MNKDFSNVKQYNGQQSSKKVSTSEVLEKLLNKNLRALTSVLPKHITPQRMARVALSTVRRVPKLSQCAPETLLMAILEASTLGLELDNRGLAYLVPFWNKKTQTTDVQLLIGYRGMVDLAYRSGNVQSIQAAVVGENDKFDYARGLHPRLEHIPNLKGKGEIIAAYAIAFMKDGAVQFEVMSREELDKVRNASKSKDDGPWKDWTEQMYIKTVLKRLCKLLPLSPEIQRATAIDDQADAGVAQTFCESLDNSVIDIPAEQEQEMNEYELEQEAAPEPIPPRKEAKNKQATLNEEVDNSYQFECPDNGRMVTESDCSKCSQRKGCPAFEV